MRKITLFVIVLILVLCSCAIMYYHHGGDAMSQHTPHATTVPIYIEATIQNNGTIQVNRTIQSNETITENVHLPAGISKHNKTTTTSTKCLGLFNKTPIYSKHSDKLLKALKTDNKDSSDKIFIENLIRNCTKTYNDFSNRFYLSDVEKNFPIAFEMLTHYRPLDIQQTIRLLMNLYRPHNAYCIHIDKHSPKWWTDYFYKFTSCFPNILMADNPIEVRYATVDILNAHLRCFKTLLNSNLEWKYVISLHGTEVPLVTNRQMVVRLKGMNGSNIVTRGVSASNPKSEVYPWLHREYNPKTSNFGKKMDVLSNVNYTLFKSAASANSAISRAMVQYMLTNEIALKLPHILEKVKSAVEFYFSTVNHFKDAPGGEYTLSEKFVMPLIEQRDWIWQSKDISRGHCAAGKVRHIICIVSAYDLPRLYKASKSSKYWFHNKYMIDFDYTVMDCMESLLVDRNIDEYKNDLLL